MMNNNNPSYLPTSPYQAPTQDDETKPMIPIVGIPTYNISVGVPNIIEYSVPSSSQPQTVVEEAPPAYEESEIDDILNEHAGHTGDSELQNVSIPTYQPQQIPTHSSPTNMYGGFSQPTNTSQQQNSKGHIVDKIEEELEDTAKKIKDIYGLSFLNNTGKHQQQETLWEAGFFGLNFFANNNKRTILQEIDKMNRVESRDVLVQDNDTPKPHNQHEHHHKLYTVMRTARGQPYLIKTGTNIDEIKE